MDTRAKLLLLQLTCLFMACCGLFFDASQGTIHGWLAASFVVYGLNISREPRP